MSVKLRLARRGRRKAPYYRIVAADSRKARDGRFIESIGQYQPLSKDEESKLVVDEDRALHWLHNGAQTSDTVRSLLRKKGIMKKFHDQKVEAKKKKAEAGG